jgi:acyl-CoA synthetase (AMP-forming)/AMP-acid ligase II
MVDERRGLHHLLLASAERDAGHPAIIRGDDVTTYGELASAAARFAGALKRLGVEHGDRVAIVYDGPEFPIAYYGTAMAGGVAVPLGDDARATSLVSTLRHAGAKALVIGGRNLRLLEGRREEVPDLRAAITVGPSPQLDLGIETVSLSSAIEAGEVFEDGGAAGDDLVAIQYTSGTTGAKKGVMLSHANLRANAASIVEYLELTSDDVIGMVLPFYYVYGGSVLHTHMAVGGTLALLGSLAFPIRVAEGLDRHRCTGFSGVPSTFARLLSLDSLSEYDLSSIRYLTQAGAAMSVEMAGRVRKAFPKARLFVMYGQTEASARLSYLPPERIEDKAGSVGFGIPGVTLEVRNEAGELCEVGEVGEVVARGDNITRGYFENPEATARSIRPDGLHTGDLGYKDDDGFLFLVGRESEMIKSGAHRIAPLEVEEVVESVDGVVQCAAVGGPHPLLGEVVVAFVVKADDSDVTDKDILRRCREELPRFKMPSEVRFVRELPRTDNGKLLRRALREQLARENKEQ